MSKLFEGIYKNKTVLVTGHTGFKGSWLCYWLLQMGARVIGYALEAPILPNHYRLLDLDMISVIGDIRDQNKLDIILHQYQPEIVFHLAAQALVRPSYRSPVDTFDVNVMGTVRLFEACRNAVCVHAIVNITSDKAYTNMEKNYAYKESDAMGGYDPYSASKGCSELITDSYRNSYFNIDSYSKEHNVLLASCRAGNVIGGGDWAEDRLVADIMISAKQKQTTQIRNPLSTRPWQHVLEPLSGYLLIGQKLLQGQKEFAEGWNFGPENETIFTVEEVLKQLSIYWKEINYEVITGNNQPHEAVLLKLDCTKAKKKLRWMGVWEGNTVFEKTSLWYKEYYESNKINTQNDYTSYIKAAKEKGLVWAN